MKVSARRLLEGTRTFFTAEQAVMLVAATAVGVLAAMGSIFFRWLIDLSGMAFWLGNAKEVQTMAALPWWQKLLTPGIGGLVLAPIVLYWAKETRGSGIPEVIEASALHGGFIRARVIVAKSLSSAICIGSGGSVGREAPIVQIGAAIGSAVAQKLKLTVRDTRTLLGCGAAGGLAATFNTPFAGTFFVVEAILGDFGSVRISPLVISSVVATVVSRHFTEEFPHIIMPPFHDEATFLSLGAFLAVGVACSLVSVLLIGTMRSGGRLARKWKGPAWALPAMGGLLVGATGLLVPEVYGVGYETTNAALAESFGPRGGILFLTLLLILVAKIFATAASLSTGGSGGVFAPALFLGALTGSLVGIVLEEFFPGLVGPEGATSIGAYAIVGMGAMIAALHHAPIAAVLLVFELTGNQATILPLMAACIPSVLLAAVLDKQSIDTMSLSQRGVIIKPRNQIDLLRGLQASDAMAAKVVRVDPGAPLSYLVERFLETPCSIMWIVGKDGKPKGVIEASTLEVAMLERESLMSLIVAQDIASPLPPTLKPGDDLSLAMRLVHQTKAEALPVLDPESGVLLGDVTREDLISIYSRELETRDTAASALDSINLSERLGGVDIGDGFSIVEHEAPQHLDGKSLAELQVRQRTGAQVILLRRRGRGLVPGPDTRVQVGDVLVLAGKADTIREKLRTL